MEVETQPEVIENKQYSLSVFQNIKAWQQQNGMRQNDYERYRRFCTVKIQRIRKRIGFLNKHGKQYQKMEFTAANVIDAESLFYPLLNAERAWAMSRELREEFGDTNNTRVHHHCNSRNRKAVAWAETFNQLCHQLADERTALESDAYLYFIKGVDRMDAFDFKPAVELFLCAKKVFSSLSQVGSSSNRDLFKARDNDLGHYLRYCARGLNLDNKGAVNLDKLEVSFDATANSLTSRLEEILQRDRMQNSEEMRIVSFRGQFITITNEDIRLSLLACRDAEQSLLQQDRSDNEMVMNAFAKVMECYDRCLRVLSGEKDKMAKTNGGVRLTEMTLLFNLEKFFKQRRSVERNVLLLQNYLQERSQGVNVNVNNVIALASNVIDALEELNQLNNELPAGNTEEETAKVDRLANSIDTLHLLYRAVRALYASESYLANHKYDYANTLCEFAQQILDTLGDDLEASLFDEDAESFVSLLLTTNLQEDVEVLSARIKAEATLEKVAVSGAVTEAKYVQEDLNSKVVFNHAGKYNIVKVPVPMHAATCKPLFFDLFADNMDYPDMTERAQTKKQESSGGWFRRWW